MSQQFIEYAFHSFTNESKTKNVYYIRALLDIEVRDKNGDFKSFPALFDSGGLILTIPFCIAEELGIDVPEDDVSRVHIGGVVQDAADSSDDPPRATAYFGKATIRLPDIPDSPIEKTDCLFMNTPKDRILITLKEVVSKFDITSGNNPESGIPGLLLTLRETETNE